MREVVMNEKTNLLQLEEHFYQLVDVEEPNVFRKLHLMTESFRIICRRISGLLIQHSVMVSSQEHHIPQNRL